MVDVTWRCTAQLPSGLFCDLPSMDDTPFPLCATHALRIYERLAQLTDIERAALSPNLRKAVDTRAKRGARNRALAALCHQRSTVYAVRCPDGVIKIGHSTNLPQRLRSLGKDVELIGFTFGDYFDEQAIHASLVEHRVRGREWYEPARPVLDVVNDMRAPFGLAPIAA